MDRAAAAAAPAQCTLPGLSGPPQPAPQIGSIRCRRKDWGRQVVAWCGEALGFRDGWQRATGHVLGLPRWVVGELAQAPRRTGHPHGTGVRHAAYAQLGHVLGVSLGDLPPMHAVPLPRRYALRDQLWHAWAHGLPASRPHWKRRPDTPPPSARRVEAWWDERGGFGDAYVAWCVEHLGPLTLAEVGARMGTELGEEAWGLSRERIRQIEEDALRKLRRAAARGSALEQRLLQLCRDAIALENGPALGLPRRRGRIPVSRG